MRRLFVRFSAPAPIRRGGLSPGRALTAVLALLLVPGVVAAEPDVSDRDRSGKSKRAGAAALQQGIDFELVNVNNVLTIFDNRGIIGQDPRTSGAFGFFPANTPNNYTFGTGLWVGGIVNATKIVSTAYDASGGFSEFNAGRVGGGGDQILCSTNADDLANWYPEFREGGSATGEPIVFSQKDCIVIYNDSNQARTVSTPIGLEVRQRTMAFTFGLLSQVVFVVWDIANTGGNTVEEAFVGVNADMDIGDQFEDDRCSAIPDLKLGFCWDEDFQEGSFNPNPPGFVGITFFQGPVGAAGDTLGLTRFTLTSNPTFGRPCPDPDSDAEQYDQMAGIGARAPCLDPVATDMRFIEISGPITFAPGQVQQVVAGYIWADPGSEDRSLEVSPTRCFPQGAPCFLPDPAEPVLAELVQVQQAAQLIFNAGFLAPAPPPKPDITLIPGDQQVTIVWTDVSQEPDPFFEIAGDPESPAFDPLFREFDFEGYTLVRSTSGDPSDIDTLAIFDIANDVASIVDTTFQLVSIIDTLTGDTISANVPTATRTMIELPNTGLQFSFTDRGLINGLVYFYDVVPFDFNPSNTLRGPEISLSAGIAFQPREVRSVRPRSNASSFEAATVGFDPLKADGTVCDASEPTATVDSLTGKYVDFIDCSNAIVQANLQAIRDVNLPSGDFFFVIDSIVPSEENPYDLAEFGGYQLAAGFNTVWFHWEDASGNLAAAIQPNVGSFDQSFSFFQAAETPIAFGMDAVGTDIGPDLSIGLVVASDFSVFEDLEVNGQSVHLGELGGEHVGEARPHAVQNSALADYVNLGNIRSVVNAREYSHPGVYAQGGTSYELTWSVQGGSYTGTLRKVPGGEIVPQGGQPKGPENPNTPGDFIAGYNWGFIGPGAPEEVQAALFPTAAPLTNTITLNAGDTFAVMVPGQSVYVEGIRQLPQDGDTWRFLIDTGSQRADFGREGGDPEDSNIAAAPFTYLDNNDASEQGLVLSPVPFDRGIVNVYPGARWRLSVAGGSNDPLAFDLSRIKVVPNPYVANAIWDFSQDNQRIEFINLPPICTIRIYTISGNLVRVLEHTDGSGTEPWDLRTRFNLKAASGTYYWHVTTPDGETVMGLMSVIQSAVGTS